MTDSTIFKPFSEIIGQESPIRFLRGVMAKGKIPHAYLFTGPSGVGKTTTALAFARDLNCHSPIDGEGCGKCLPCRKIMNGNFPDLGFVEPQGQNIKIQQMRDLTRALSFKPVGGRYRVSIIREAETMTDEAANSFLKTLEEPYPDNIFILNVREALDLLPTIVSRCQKISFRPIHTDAIADWLMEKKGLDQERARVLAKISEGSLGRAIRMCEGDYLEKRQEYLFRLLNLSTLSWELSLEMALVCAGEQKRRGTDSSQTGEIGLLDLLSIWQTWYRDLILIKMGSPTELLINLDFSHKLKNVSKSYTIENLIKSFMVLDQAQRDLLRTRNLDLMMENTVLSLKRLSG
ncbi:MAG: DNA polymerase III subunit delta' [Pseudomonadota bacterium]